MSFDLFADADAVVEVPFNNGASVTLRKFSDAGMQEDLEAESARMRLHEAEEGEDPEESEEDYMYLQVKDANSRLVQKMILSITDAEGNVTNGPFSLDLVKRFSRPAFVVLIDTIYEHNPPLSAIRGRLAREKMERDEALIQATMTDGSTTETMTED